MTDLHLTEDAHLALVEAAANQLDDLRTALSRAEANRDLLIREAYAAGVDVKLIADRAGLHYKRIYQIRDAGRAGSAPITDDALPDANERARQRGLGM